MMESPAILVFAKRPFNVHKSIKDQGCLIDESLLLKLGMKVKRIEYTKFTLENGSVTKCCGYVSATSQIVENGLASKSITFKGRIIRDLGCDAVGDQIFFNKFQSLKPLSIKSQDIKNVFNSAKNRNGKEKRETSLDNSWPPYDDEAEHKHYNNGDENNKDSYERNHDEDNDYEDNEDSYDENGYNENGYEEDECEDDFNDGDNCYEPPKSQDNSWLPYNDEAEHKLYNNADKDDKSEECEDEFNEDESYEDEYEHYDEKCEDDYNEDERCEDEYKNYDKGDEDDTLEKSHKCEDDNDEETVSVPISKSSDLSLNKNTVSYIEHLVKFEAGLDLQNSGWYEIQDSDPTLSELCSLIESGQAPTSKNKVLKRDFYKKHGDPLENPGDLKRLYGRFRKGDLQLDEKGNWMKRERES